MQVLLLSHSVQGGAGRATYRLHLGLRKIGVDSQVLVQLQYPKVPGVVSQSNNSLHKISSKLKLRRAVDKFPLNFYKQRTETPFSPQWIPDSLPRNINELRPDIINLHWTGHGFLKIESVTKFKTPIVVTLHDMWAFTGGCHYTGSCDLYTKQCGNCPQLNSNCEADLSRWIWKRKSKAWKPSELTFIAPSSWLAECARNSSLLQGAHIEVVPNGLDIQAYKPLDKEFSRHAFNLPHDRKLILFGAMLGTSDHRKGFSLLRKALKTLEKYSPPKGKIELVIFGNSDMERDSPEGYITHHLGYFSDTAALSLLYSACDVMVVPSTEEAFGQAASEAMSCGTPVIAFNTTGLKDIIDHEKTGYLAEPFDPSDLAHGILWVLEDKTRYFEMGKLARLKAENQFSDTHQARRYQEIFQKVLGSS